MLPLLGDLHFPNVDFEQSFTKSKFSKEIWLNSIADLRWHPWSATVSNPQWRQSRSPLNKRRYPPSRTDPILEKRSISLEQLDLYRNRETEGCGRSGPRASDSGPRWRHSRPTPSAAAGWVKKRLRTKISSRSPTKSLVVLIISNPKRYRQSLCGSVLSVSTFFFFQKEVP